MHFAIRTSFILAVLFCLWGNGKARMIDQDRNRLQQLQLQSQQTTDVDTQLRITNEVIEIFEKYKGQVASNAVEEAELNTQVNDFKGNTVLIDGVPAQGGFWNILGGLKSASEAVPDNVKKDAKNLLNSSSKALVENLSSYLINKLYRKFGLAK
ncbi:protein Turandot Z [Drosophila rhopaloa]|uniref:Protein Turandot Z n=1 Tax=Drosophila rhopaloa TaxID=1041015 RepID=A0A6P4EZX7_DRORH|nr:protein Turandot Z [Drosophila rhopaloa]